VNPSEVELATRLLAGDQAALSPLLETIQRKVFQYTWLMCGQREDAEEVAQDTLLKVSQNWHQLADPNRIKPWMFSIARNCCLTMRRKSVFAPVAEIPYDTLPLPSSDPDPEAQLLQHELSAEVEAALRLGHPIRVHADQFTSLGMLGRAIRLGARSVDHLEATTPQDATLLAASRCIAVALPVCVAHLGKSGGTSANLRSIVDQGGTVAIASS
jgi:hypothetical protein